MNEREGEQLDPARSSTAKAAVCLVGQQPEPVDLPNEPRLCAEAGRENVYGPAVARAGTVRPPRHTGCVRPYWHR